MTRTILTSFLLTIATIACTDTSNTNNSQQAPYIYVLGVAQDAGLPQAGCYAKHCLAAWNNYQLRRKPTSIAVVDSKHHEKLLFEATPALPQQLYDLEQIANSPNHQLAGVFITHAHIGHYTGLMYFGHEAMGAKSIPVFAMPRMKAFLETNGPWSQLVKFKNIDIQSLAHGVTINFERISVSPFLVPHRDEFSETVGYELRGPNKKALFIPDINKWSVWEEDITKRIESVDYALIDATFFDGDELPGRDMSKIPHPFVVESMALLDKLPVQQRNKVVFIHMNHSNPLLDINSEAHQLVINKGYQIATEGLKLQL